MKNKPKTPSKPSYIGFEPYLTVLAPRKLLFDRISRYLFRVLIPPFGIPLGILYGKRRCAINEILEYAGLNHIRFEDLRHTFAVLALERGMPVKELSQIMGYARITVARQLYQEYFPVNPVEPQSGVPKDRKIIRATNTLCFTVKKKK